MPPTLKDSSRLPTSPENPERSAEGTSAGQQIISAQPVTLEVPVTVNGARAVEGSDKREPFSETTSTVLVLAGGAVIRLSSSVASGQLLFLTNEKTKKEVVCQVVKSKNYRNVSGYVKLEANRLQEQLSALLFAEQKQSEAKPGVSVAAPSKQELGDAAAKIFDMT